MCPTPVQDGRTSHDTPVRTVGRGERDLLVLLDPKGDWEDGDQVTRSTQLEPYHFDLTSYLDGPYPRPSQLSEFVEFHKHSTRTEPPQTLRPPPHLSPSAFSTPPPKSDTDRSLLT